MKRRFVPYCLFIFLLISAGLRSQDTSIVIPGEGLQVCTDRTMYIAGEKIHFSAFIINALFDPEEEISRILYNELITPDGTRLTGGKYTVDHSTSGGCLLIPGETVTGIYFLKTYTRFMRNGSPENYHYIMLKIINPYKDEVLTGYEVTDTFNFQVEDYLQGQTGTSFKISPDKKSYVSREEIEIKIEGNMKSDHPGKLCLAVIPELAYDDQHPDKNESVIYPGAFQYYPETRGISLSGRLLEDDTGNPVPNALVNLSIIGDKDVMAIRTNASGQFYFTLPGYSGNRDIFLCGEDMPGLSSTIFIDNDFCSRPVNLPAPAFHLTENERETAYKLAVNQKLTTIFQRDTLNGRTGILKDSISFYGKPDEILVMEKFIDLPTIEDYFHELVGSVNVRKFEGRKIFRFNTNRTEMTIYDPLVLIDWVAVNDIEKILAMLPKLIERIELVNSPYIKGNIMYGGIISFVSKNNDFAGIDLPTSGTFINYNFLDEFSQITPAGPSADNIPDSRNTIYWHPDVKINEKGAVNIRVTAPDTPGKYIIMLRGIGFNGDSFMIREVIEVDTKSY